MLCLFFFKRKGNHSRQLDSRVMKFGDLHTSTRSWPIKLFCEFSCCSILIKSIFLNLYDFLLNFRKKIFFEKVKIEEFKKSHVEGWSSSKTKTTMAAVRQEADFEDGECSDSDGDQVVKAFR